MSKETGGSAFPYFDPDMARPALNTGMTLRDWFAGMALMGRLASGVNPAVPASGEIPTVGAYFAAQAYAYADFMLEERARP